MDEAIRSELDEYVDPPPRPSSATEPAHVGVGPLRCAAPSGVGDLQLAPARDVGPHRSPRRPRRRRRGSRPRSRGARAPARRAAASRAGTGTAMNARSSASRMALMIAARTELPVARATASWKRTSSAATSAQGTPRRRASAATSPTMCSSSASAAGSARRAAQAAFSASKGRGTRPARARSPSGSAAGCRARRPRARSSARRRRRRRASRCGSRSRPGPRARAAPRAASCARRRRSTPRSRSLGSRSPGAMPPEAIASRIWPTMWSNERTRCAGTNDGDGGGGVGHGLTAPERQRTVPAERFNHSRSLLMQLADSLNRLGTETAFEVLARAKALEARGAGSSTCRSASPTSRRRATSSRPAARRWADGETHYCPAPGLPVLREACAAHLSRHRGLEIDPGNVARRARARSRSCSSACSRPATRATRSSTRTRASRSTSR